MADLRAQIEIELIDKASAKASSIAAATDRLRETQLKAAQAAAKVAHQDLVAARAAVERAQSMGEGATAAAALERAEAKAATAAQRVAAAELRAAKAARDLSRETKRATSASKAHAQAEQVEAAATKAVAAAETNTRDARAKSGRQLAEKVNLASELALGFGALNPKVMQVGLAFASAGNNAYALGAALGPIGVIGGVLLAVVPALAAAFGAAGDEAEEAGEQFDAATAYLSDMERQAINTAEGLRQVAEGIARARDEATYQQRIESGQGSVDEQEALLRAREASVTEFGARVGRARFDLAKELEGSSDAAARQDLIMRAVERGDLSQRRGLTAGLDEELIRELEGLSSALPQLEASRDEAARFLAEAQFRESEEATREKAKRAAELDAAKIAGRDDDPRSRGASRGPDVTEIVRAISADPSQRRVEGAIDIRINGRSAGQLPVTGGAQSATLVDVASIDPEAVGGLSS